MLLLTSLGFVAGGICGGLLTFYCYFIGSWLGAPIGAALGAGKGWKMPLRHSIILFFTFWGSWIVTYAFAKHIHTDEPMFGDIMKYILPPLGAIFGGALFYLLIREFTTFAQRRSIAMGMSVVIGLWAFWQLFAYAYLWQPGS